MFGLKVVTKNELLLWQHQVETLQDEVKRLHQEVERERKRAEAAINALLVRSAKVALAPEPTPAERDRELGDWERNLDSMFNIFAEDPTKEEMEKELLERIQS